MSHVDAALPANGLPMPPRRTCAALEEHRRLLNEDPGYAARRAAIETLTWEFRTGARKLEREGVTRIPVVVHVVWNTPAQNISDAQIQSQIDVVNRDFRKTNTDGASVPAVWNTIAADARIEFFLATTDPNGNPTTGITRTRTARTAFPFAGNPVKGSATGGVDPWPADRYLNMWVCRLEGGLLGYAEFPGAPASIDGVVITDTAFGTTGTAVAPFDRGRTATHEIGHWLNLFHIWGDDGTGCAGNDGADDTPNQAGPNYGCPTVPSVTCGNGPHGDMFMNFMDYTDDACMFMFTAGQMMRMQATLDGPRSTLGQGAPAQQIDAALYSGAKCYFFSGNQYIRVTRTDAGAGTVDSGYPKPASTWGWPAGFGANGIDAALYSHTKCYFFSGNQYIRMTRGDAGAGAVDAGYPKPITNWGWPAGFGANGIDAALYSRSKCYFFSGNQYIRVTRDDAGRGTVDPGYPKPISTWGWPAGFGANGIDAALYSGSKNYFFAGNHYIRVTRGDVSRGTVDPGYPKPISTWGWPDF